MPKISLPRRQKQANDKNIYAFIDSQNLNLGIQRLGWKMDWKKFRTFLKETYGVREAFMFIGYMPEHEDLYMQLHEAGFKVVLKPTYDMTRPHPEMDPSVKDDKAQTSKKQDEEEKHIKGNIDADLVLFAMKEWPNYSKAIIVSGDGDFYSLIEHLERYSKLQHILTPNQHYSNLFNAFDKYIVTLDGFRDKLAYRDRKKKPRGKKPSTKGKKPQGNNHKGKKKQKSKT